MKSDDQVKVEYINDSLVDADLDKQLRELLSTCFTRLEDAMFKERRYWKEPPQHRWFIRSTSGEVIAHIAVHEKTIGTDVGDITVGGVGEVCVHPQYRGRGLVRRMLAVAHEWLSSHEFPFSLLFGEQKVYASSGYVPVKNVFHYRKMNTTEWVREKLPLALVKQLADKPWPDGEVDLRGPIF